ncbi:hypothetical protein [Aureliella helgolandensis]|uniref:Uncharacterized protein n=1 Tax=Aureliella helgolandensis TaxID=2527968 RepID=A0A518G5X2_9BACT|nr:hypothetical protein [Aureliella helgolandensis]QDV23990.1 hypothetical protein Q31a_23030 [Aureliella helgolandensis]
MGFCRSVAITTSLAICASGLFSPTLSAQTAQNQVAIVSISPLDNLMKDVNYLLQATSFPEMGGLFGMMAKQYTRGIDGTRPIGVSVSLAGETPSALIFLPLSDRQQFFGALAGVGIEPDDLGDGVFAIDAGSQVIYAKDSGGWLFVAQTEGELDTVPSDPAALLGDLPSRYTVAVKVDVQAVPDELKLMAVDQMQKGFDRASEKASEQSAEEAAIAREAGQAQIQQVRQLLEETEQFTVGWAVRAEEQRTFFDAGAQFLAGTELASQAASYKDLTTDFSAFQLADSAISFHYAAEILEGAPREAAKNSMRTSLGQAAAMLKKQANMDEATASLLTDLLNGLGEITIKTIDEGKFDGAGSVILGDSLRVLIGSRIADGSALAAELKKVAAGLPQGSGAPASFEFDYAEHAGVDLHRIRVPIKTNDRNVQRVLGEELLVTVGTASKAYLISVDQAGDASLKAAIDQMKGSLGQPTTPFDSVVRFGQILQFAQTISPNPMLSNALNTIKQYAGKDTVTVSGRSVERGGVYRFSIDEGVLRTIGATAKSGGGGF